MYAHHEFFNCSYPFSLSLSLSLSLFPVNLSNTISPSFFSLSPPFSSHPQPVQPCSVNFPLHNYTINIDGSVALVLTPDRVVAGVPLTGLQLAGLAQDNSFSVTVMACNNVTCRTSDANTLSK